MRFNINESMIINQIMEGPDKFEFLDKLERVVAKTENRVLKQDIKSLYRKINSLSKEQVQQIYTDRVHNQISLYPPYKI